MLGKCYRKSSVHIVCWILFIIDFLIEENFKKLVLHHFIVEICAYNKNEMEERSYLTALKRYYLDVKDDD